MAEPFRTREGEARALQTYIVGRVRAGNLADNPNLRLLASHGNLEPGGVSASGRNYGQIPSANQRRFLFGKRRSKKRECHRQYQTELFHHNKQSILWGRMESCSGIAVGMTIADHPPHRSVLAELPHKMCSSTFYAICGR
jgi:hypothetical protein